MQAFTDEQLNAWRAKAEPTLQFFCDLVRIAAMTTPRPLSGSTAVATWSCMRTAGWPSCARSRRRVTLRQIGIFTLDRDKTRMVMEGDPAVQAGVLVYDVYEVRGLPGDALPG